ncbi:MAG: hypothetical protein ABR936_13895 [Bacteroidota bacterium]|jgi:hypothetical protein
MKKIFQSSQWKRHSRRISERELRHKQKIALYKKLRNRRLFVKYGKESVRIFRSVKPQKQHNKIEINVPSSFSIVTNPEEMLEFYNAIYYYASKDQAIYLEMSDIMHISADAILYTISLFDHLEHKFRFGKLSGSFPKNERIKNVLLESSFFNYIHANFPYNPDNSKILSVKSGRNAEGKIAKQVMDFSTGILKQNKTSQSKSIYGTIIECMVNTKHHAYHDLDHKWKWWLMALPNEDNNKIQFAFLDNGAGIPTTVKKNFTEKVNRLFGSNSPDCNLIHSALLGHYRTRMKDKWRGKGLPKIYSYFNSNYIENLHIVSNHGYVDCKKDLVKEMNDKFHGTLLSWDFV